MNQAICAEQTPLVPAKAGIQIHPRFQWVSPGSRPSPGRAGFRGTISPIPLSLYPAGRKAGKKGVRDRRTFGKTGGPPEDLAVTIRNLSPRLAGAAFALLIAGASPAAAGPPYVSDDPEPTDLGHWEVYNFVAATRTPGETEGQAGLDINYGGAKDLQLTAVVPLDFESHVPGGPGDVELAVKYRFLHQADGSPLPDVAVFPRVILPTAGPQFGPQRLSLQLPIWAQKDFGKWSLFGGGDYDINPGPDNRNYGLGGLALSRALTDRLSLGAEVYHQTPATVDAKDFTGLNLGAIYKLTDHWSLLGSAGPGVQNPRQGGQYDVYVALEATY
jgi:hypothetical protein